MANASPLLWILSFTLLACVLSLIAGGGYLMLPARLRDRTLSHLISFATGTLLGVTFLELLPQALAVHAGVGSERVMAMVLAGIFVFFTLEKALIWRHSHAHEAVAHDHLRHAHGSRSAGPLILVGDTFHNFLDGVLLTAVFVTDIELGIVTGLAMIAHEIPQELGDFAIMIASGISRARTFAFNALSSLAMVAGALLAWWQVALIEAYLPYVLAFTGASFIYIAVADLIPALHRGARLTETFTQLGLMSAGLALIGLFHGSH